MPGEFLIQIRIINGHLNVRLNVRFIVLVTSQVHSSKTETGIPPLSNAPYTQTWAQTWAQTWVLFAHFLRTFFGIS